MTERTFTSQLRFISNLVAQLQIQYDATRVGIMGLEGTGRHYLRLNEILEKQPLLGAITERANRYRGGNVDFPRALRAARISGFDRSNGDRPAMPNILVIVVSHSTGFDNERDLRRQIQLIKEAFIHVMVVVHGFESSDPAERRRLVGKYAILSSDLASDNVILLPRSRDLDRRPPRTMLNRLCQEIPGLNNLNRI